MEIYKRPTQAHRHTHKYTQMDDMEKTEGPQKHFMFYLYLNNGAYYILMT